MMFTKTTPRKQARDCFINTAHGYTVGWHFVMNQTPN